MYCLWHNLPFWTDRLPGGDTPRGFQELYTSPWGDWYAEQIITDAPSPLTSPLLSSAVVKLSLADHKQAGKHPCRGRLACEYHVTAWARPWGMGAVRSRDQRLPWRVLSPNTVTQLTVEEISSQARLLIICELGLFSIFPVTCLWLNPFERFVSTRTPFFTQGPAKCVKVFQG